MNLTVEHYRPTNASRPLGAPCRRVDVGVSARDRLRPPPPPTYRAPLSARSRRSSFRARRGPLLSACEHVALALAHGPCKAAVLVAPGSPRRA
eukprot:scaffold31693_cov112-Isochrysis_galbana.AAC.1